MSKSKEDMDSKNQISVAVSNIDVQKHNKYRLFENDLLELVQENDVLKFNDFISYYNVNCNGFEFLRPSEFGNSLLMVAIKNKSYEIVRSLAPRLDKFDVGALIKICKDGDLESLKLLAEFRDKIPDINSKLNLASPYLIEACNSGKGEYLGVVEFLLTLGADPNIMDNGCTTALYSICKNSYEGSNEFIPVLLRYGANLDVRARHDNYTPLEIACKNTNDEAILIVNVLLNSGLINKNNLQLAFYNACLYGSSKVMEILLRVNPELVKVDFAKNDKSTPLIIACAIGNMDKIKLLLNNGADINKFDKNYNSALKSAAGNMRYDIFEFLLENGADIENLASNGMTILFHLVEPKYLSSLNIILSKPGLNLNHKDNTGQTAIFRACAYGGREIIDLLLDKGLTIDIKDNNGKTPLFEACSELNLDTVKYLVEEKQMNIHHQNNNGETVLFAACQYSTPQIIGYLLEKGVDKNIRNNNGKVALDVLKVRCNQELKDKLAPDQHERKPPTAAPQIEVKRPNPENWVSKTSSSQPKQNRDIHGGTGRRWTDTSTTRGGEESNCIMS